MQAPWVAPSGGDVQVCGTPPAPAHPVLSQGIDFPPREQDCYQALFAEADTEGSGRVGGRHAVTFLSRSGLEKQVLKQIWDVADSSGSGWLDFADFSVALRLVAHAQSGRTTTPGMARLEPLELPTFRASGDAARPVPRLLGGLTGGVPEGALYATSPAAMPVRGRSPARADKVVPTPRDLRKFGRLFCGMVGPGGTMLDATRGAGLLKKSGVAEDLLSHVWNMADTGQKGGLTWPEFVLAMHLVHRLRAQLPLPLPGGLPADLLQLLASLQDAQAYAGQPSRSPRATSRASSPFASAAGTSPAASARSVSPCAGKSPRSVPSGAEIRKYARLFVRTTAPSGASSVSAVQAKDLLAGSGLEKEALARVWDLSDMDRDTSLCWPEFVLAMHLIQRARARLPLPLTPSEMPQELIGALGALEPAQAYASRPRSRSTSRAPSAEPAAPAKQQPEPFAPAAQQWEPVAPATQQWETFGDGPSSDPEPRAKRREGSRGRRDGGGGGDPDHSEKHRPGKGDRGDGTSRSPEPRSDRRSGRRGSGSRDRHNDGSHGAWEAESGMEEAVPKSNADSSHFSFELPRERHGSRPPVDALAAGGGRTAVVAAMVEGDRNLSKELRSSCDELHHELERLEDLCKREEQLMSREHADGERAALERQNLTQQVEASQCHLAELKRELQASQCQSILLRRDSDHYAAEHTFLQRIYLEGSNDVQALQQSVEYLEQSNQSLVAHIANLQLARGEVLQQLQYEEQVLVRERHEANRIKQTLAALKGSGADPLLRAGRLAFAGSDISFGGDPRGTGFGDAVATALSGAPAAAAQRGAVPGGPCGCFGSPPRAPLDLREGV